MANVVACHRIRNMRLVLGILCFLVPMISLEASVRHRRAGGRVDLPVRVRAPLKLRKGETAQPPPGWKHCVHTMKATQQWRIINSAEFSKHLSTQFQCTWYIQPTRPTMKIQIAVQKLELGNDNKAHGCAQFLEIIDHGKPQGRYCKRNMPQGDYVTMGKTVRLDIQGDGALAKLVQDKKNPFMISYRSVLDNNVPGFRAKTTKPGVYDPHHINTQSVLRPGENGLATFGRGKNNIKQTNSINKDKDKERNSKKNALSTEALVAIIVCCGLVVLLVVFIVVWRCCCVTLKRDHDNDYEQKVENAYPGYAYEHAQSEALPSYIEVVTSDNAALPASRIESSDHNSHGSKIEKKPLDGGKVNKAFVNNTSDEASRKKKKKPDEVQRKTRSTRHNNDDIDRLRRKRRKSPKKEDTEPRSRPRRRKQLSQERHKEQRKAVERPRTRRRKSREERSEEKRQSRRRRTEEQSSPTKKSRRRTIETQRSSKGRDSKQNTEKVRSSRRRSDKTSRKKRLS